MIKLIRPDKPIQLTEEKEKELVEEFKRTEKSVWNKSYIKKTISNMSNSKCCYCETKVNEQGKPMHIEHFHPKKLYPNEVVSWGNLLPSCSQCNSNKGPHDTYAEPIIDPSIDDPREYIYLQSFYLKSKDNSPTSKGRFTVELLDLNNRKLLLDPRIKISSALVEKLIKIYNRALELKNGTNLSQFNRNKVINGIRDLLIMAQPDAEYSAFMATVILNDEDYKETKEILIEMGFWDAEMQNFHDVADSIKLDTHK